MDVNGYFAPAGPGGLSLYNVNPCRIIDTREPSGTPPQQGTQTINASASNCQPPTAARAYVLGSTAVPQGLLGYLTLWPQDQPQPLASTLNALDGAVTSNMALVPTSNGRINAFMSHAGYLILDVSGYFAP